MVDEVFRIIHFEDKLEFKNRPMAVYFGGLWNNKLSNHEKA